MADVVFMSLNTPNAWYYTSRSGRIAKKSKQNVTIKSIYRTYKNIAKSYGSERYIAVVHRGSRSTVVSDSGLDDFRSLLKGADSISSFIPPRIRNISEKVAPMFCNFHVDFTRTKDGRHRERIYRLGAPLGIDVHHANLSKAFTHSGETISVAKPINRQLKKLCEEIVTAVEHGNRRRVIKFEAYFQVDTDGTAWITSTRNLTCGTIKDSESRIKVERETHTEIFDDTKAESPISDKLPTWATAGENIMGSSQSRQCPGDFCGLDFSVAEQQPDPFLDRRNTRPGTSLRPGTSGSSYRPGTSSYRPGTSTSRLSSLSLPSVKGSIPKKSTHNMAGSQTISYGMVLHARAEHKLVKLMIEREQRSEEGDYMQDNVIYSSSSEISMQNPGSYYRRVHVCNNCFNMYSKIDEARSASLKRLEAANGPRQRTASRGQKRPGSRQRSKLQRTPKRSTTAEKPSEGETGLGELTEEQQLQVSLAQASKALNQFSLKDLAELRGFRSPPAMVAMVVRVLMRMLSGREVEFSAAKKIMANGKKFLSILRSFQEVSPHDVQSLIPFLHSATFNPDLVKRISPAAGRVCEWITGMIITSAIKYGYGDQVRPRSNPPEPVRGGRMMQRAKTTPAKRRSSRKPDKKFTKKDFKALTGIKAKSPPQNHLSRSLPNSKPNLSSFRAVTGKSGKPKKRRISAKKKKQNLRRKLQQKTLDRLSQSDLVATKIPTSADRPEFIASDGAVMPYMVLGEPDLDLKCPAFVVLHDMFDTLENMQILFSKIVRKHLGTQILVLNFPGQAYAQVAETDGDPLLHNVYLSSVLCELLHWLEKQGKFICSMRPFFLMGFGNGGNVGTCFASKYGTTDVFFRSSLKGMVLFNSFSYVDEQLAAILNSTVNVVSVLPPDRPDLPVSYFSRFLFSKKYMDRVDRNIILNLYTAVSNPITNNGRVLMCKGAIKHADLRAAVQELSLPILVVQSTANNLVNPKHVDPYIEGREVTHIWAHQQKIKSGYSRDNKQKILRLFGESERDALVVWLDAGHEIRQECKQHVVGIMELLAAGLAPANVKTESAGASKQRATEAKKKRPPPSLDNALDIKEHEIDAVTDNAKRALQTIQKSNDKAAVQELNDRIEERLESFQHQNSERERIKQLEQELELARVREKREKQRAQWRREDEERGQAINKEYRNERVQRERTSKQELKARKQRQDEMVKETSKKLSKLSAEAEAAALPKPGHTKPAGPLVQMTFGLQDEHQVAFVVQETFVANLSMAVAIHAEEVRITGEDSQNNTLTLMMKAHVGQQLWKAAKNGALEALPEFKYLQAGVKGKMERISRDGSIGPVPTEEPAPEQPGAVSMTLHIPELELDDFDKNLIEKALLAVIAESGGDVAQLVVLSAESGSLIFTFKAVANIANGENAEEKKQQLQALVNRLLAEGKFADGLSRSYRKNLTATDQAAEAAPGQEGSGDAIADMFAQMAEDEKEKGKIYAQQYDARQAQLDAMNKVQRDLEAAEAEREAFRQAKKDARLRRSQDQATVVVQAIVRGMLARHERERLAEQKELAHVYGIATVRAQALVRRFIARIKVAALREKRKREEQALEVAKEAQRIYRGRLGRKKALLRRQDLASRKMQRVYRGRQGRRRWKGEKSRQLRVLRDNKAAARMQSIFRMYKAQILYQQRYMEDLAAIAVQRTYRGLLARRRAKRMREWAGTAPGPERLKLGLKLIENSKEAFERQRREIETLHRDQEKAEVKVSFIHAGLRESEKELGILEQELQNIDQLDQDLRELTHEKEIYDKRIQMDGGVINTRGGLMADDGGNGTTAIMDAEAQAAAEKAKADSYALEMAIHMKRAEREKKKKELEAEFSAVMHEINDKRKSLASLENAIQDMELTRHRKDREFARLQRDLMELLEEQKKELDHLREKGVELEVATATSAAAAARTAEVAKKHEQKTKAIFQGTEELLKFQFMSMSLGYFNSLNMLKSLRDMNSDTTSSAITSSAQTALAAATAATAANIPTMKHLKLGAHDVIDAIAKKRELDARERDRKIEEAKMAMETVFPEDVREWNIKHVGQWLDTLVLGQYKAAFEEAAIDGMYLLELIEKDLESALGMKHELHRKKLLFARDKLKPLSIREMQQRRDVENEQLAENLRSTEAAPNDLDAIFSYARNGRRRKLEDALARGFNIDAEDEFGNTLIIIAAQQVNMGLSEMLLKRGASVNRQNHLGNTALHYVMAYDPSGDLGEYLIAHGADDTLENKWGLSPYDGISAEDA